MSDAAAPAQLGDISATCGECGTVISTPPTATEMKEVEGQISLVIALDSADLELHMLNHAEVGG